MFYAQTLTGRWDGGYSILTACKGEHLEYINTLNGRCKTFEEDGNWWKVGWPCVYILVSAHPSILHSLSWLLDSGCSRRSIIEFNLTCKAESGLLRSHWACRFGPCWGQQRAAKSMVAGPWDERSFWCYAILENQVSSLTAATQLGSILIFCSELNYVWHVLNLCWSLLDSSTCASKSRNTCDKALATYHQCSSRPLSWGRMRMFDVCAAFPVPVETSFAWMALTRCRYSCAHTLMQFRAYNFISCKM